MLWERSDAWVGSQIDDSLVMVDIDTGKYVALNVTANAIWDALDVPRSQEEVVDLLRKRFAIDEGACAGAVAKALARMRELKLATPR